MKIIKSKLTVMDGLLWLDEDGVFTDEAGRLLSEWDILASPEYLSTLALRDFYTRGDLLPHPFRGRR